MNRVTTQTNTQIEVPPGYRQTDVGVIPDDWEVKSISDIANVKTGPFGSALHERDYVEEGTPIITVEHLSEFGILHQNLPLVSDSDKSRLKSYWLRHGDIVFSRVGSVDRNSLVRDAEEGWLFSGRLLRVRTFTSSAYSPYLSYHFSSESFKQRVRSVAVGQTMASLNTQILKAVTIVFPPLPEQCAIAAVLTDVDELIAALDKLIAKKRAMKLATMQQLLTGKICLPGFSEEWEAKTLGEIADILKGSGLSKGKLDTSGNNKCILYGELFTTYKQVIAHVVSRTNATEGRLSKYGDILMPGSTTTVGIDLATASALLEDDVLLGSDIIILRKKDNSYNSEFLAHYLTQIKKHAISELAQGITIIHIYGSNLVNLELRIPATVEKQDAISAVISDMDTEIDVLERRVEKTKAIKQGMMQVLLTGRVRLVNREASS